MAKKKISNVMLAVIISLVVLYTVGAFILEAFCEREISPTLTGSFFTFCGVELVNLAAIKTTKVKHGQDIVEGTETSQEAEE
jgi:xanthine/uracil permease